MDVSSLSRRDRCSGNPYPAHYRPALAFSILLCPHPRRLPLRVAFPDWPGGDTGLPCSAEVPGSVRCRLYTEGSTSATEKRRFSVPGHTPFGPSLSAPLACSLLTMLTAIHLCSPYDPTLAPYRFGAGRVEASSRLLLLDLVHRLHCPESFTPRNFFRRMFQ
jgi:hypothetical protein